MAIRNTAGLDALRALSEGGSAGLNAYKTAQGKESASRTTALQGALGGNDVAAAATKAQAEYAPKVDTSGVGIGQLGTAANSYLSQAANKLAAQKYESDASLALQADALARQSVSEKDRALMLQAAADAMGEQQLSQTSTDPVTKLAQDKAALRSKLTEFDKAAQSQLAGGPAVAAAIGPALEQQRGDILREMAGIDQQFAQASNTYASALGTDNKGLLDSYGREDMAGVQGLTEFLAPQQAEAERGIAASGESRMRELAPAFGYNPLAAAGMFREGSAQDKDLTEANALADEESFIRGDVSPKQADEQAAATLGFPSVTDYKQVRGRTNMTADDIAATMQDDAWGGITEAYENNVVNGGDYDDLKTGIKDYVNALGKPDGMTDEQWRKKKTQIIELGSAYYKDAAKTTEE